MNSRRKQRQRNEVREFLHAVRLELAAERAGRECTGRASSPVMRLNEVVARVCLATRAT